jgi:hypothetical protein
MKEIMCDLVRICEHCNGAGRITMIDLGDGILRTPKQAKARREADARISEAAMRKEREEE